MEFVETPTFTRCVTALLSDDEYRGLQNLLLEEPTRGSVVRNGGGIRKMRYALPGRGKSGGVRLIYYWATSREHIYMLLLYPKSMKDTLTDRETAVLRALVKSLAKEL